MQADASWRHASAGHGADSHDGSKDGDSRVSHEIGMLHLLPVFPATRWQVAIQFFKSKHRLRRSAAGNAPECQVVPMPIDEDFASASLLRKSTRRWRRFLPAAAVVILLAVVLLTDLRNVLSLDTLVRHRAAIDAFIVQHRSGAIAAYLALYIAVVALSVPGSAVLTLAGGFLFGTLVGGSAAVIGATVGAALIFQIARSAFGENLLRRAGPWAAKLADGFKADAFQYLLFLRLVPAFPFWLVNLAAALFAVPLPTFVTATAIGIVPAALAFAFAGAGLDSVIAAQADAYRECVAASGSKCHIDFDLEHILTPQLLGALLALGALALVPVALKRCRKRGSAPSA
jgi:uncharacterized membrane protein YdjX (TVP38/TMEM64 family)